MKDQNSDSASQAAKKQNPVMFKPAVPPTSRDSSKTLDLLLKVTTIVTACYGDSTMVNHHQ